MADKISKGNKASKGKNACSEKSNGESKVRGTVKDRKTLNKDNPEDFYDSLVNSGLNVIDSWDEKKKASKVSNRNKSEKDVKPKKNSKSPQRISSRSPKRYDRSPRRIVPKWSPIRRSRSPRRRSRSPRRRSRSPRRCRRSPRRNETSVRNSSKEHNVRYESPTTIQKQIIYEKGIIAESGLVPPGTETEFDLTSLREVKESKEGNELKSDSRLRFSPPNRMRFSPPDHVKDKLKFSPPPKRASPSPLRRRRSPSPFRRRSPSPPRRRSPASRRRSVSPSRRRSASPSRRSPSKKKSFLEEIQEKFAQKEKKSFLTEINEKLQLQSAKPLLVAYPPIQPNYTHLPTPPVQQRNTFQPNLTQLGTQPGFLQQNFPQLVQQLPVLIPQTPPLIVPPQPVPRPVFPIGGPPHMPTNQVKLPSQNQTKQETAVNFADKKITLTEYVQHTTPKPADKPVSIQNKISVIKRCQEAINYLNRDVKGSGRFVLKTNPINVEETEELKKTSPFKKYRTTKLQFTSLKWAQDIQIMALCLNRLIMKLDKKVLFDATTIRVRESSKTEPVSAVMTEPVSPVMTEPVSPVMTEPVSPVTTERVNSVTTERVNVAKEQIPEATLNKKSFSEELKVFFTAPKAVIQEPKKPEPKKPIMKTSGTQTEKIKCEDCEKRNKIQKSNIYMQTEEVLTYDISCQTHSEEVQKPPTPVKSILKKQSLSNLTPAQLLQEGPDMKRQRFAETALNERSLNPYDSHYGNMRRPNVNSNNFDIAPYDTRYEPDPYDSRYEPEPMMVDRYDEIMSSNSNKLFDRERPVTSRSFMNKAVPFSNFDPSLRVDYGPLRPPASSSNAPTNWPPRRY